MKQRVNERRAGVRQTTAARQTFLCEPGADARDLAVSMREGTRVIYLPEIAALDGLPRALGVLIETQIFSDHDRTPVLLGRGHNLCGLLGIRRHWLLD